MKRVMLAVHVMVAITVAALGMYVVSLPSIDQLKTQGTGMIAALEAYRQENRIYSGETESAGVQLPITAYETWRYRTAEDRLSFTLTVGDYSGLEPFVLAWESENGEWSLDN